jgi:hypothetical protein
VAPASECCWSQDPRLSLRPSSQSLNAGEVSASSVWIGPVMAPAPRSRARCLVEGLSCPGEAFAELRGSFCDIKYWYDVVVEPSGVLGDEHVYGGKIVGLTDQ